MYSGTTFQMRSMSFTPPSLPLRKPLYALARLQRSGNVYKLAEVARNEEFSVRFQVELRGPMAEKIVRIADREGNKLSAVGRRLISVGLRHEPGEESSNAA